MHPIDIFSTSGLMKLSGSARLFHIWLIWMSFAEFEVYKIVFAILG